MKIKYIKKYVSNSNQLFDNYYEYIIFEFPLIKKKDKEIDNLKENKNILKNIIKNDNINNINNFIKIFKNKIIISLVNKLFFSTKEIKFVYINIITEYIKFNKSKEIEYQGQLKKIEIKKESIGKYDNLLAKEEKRNFYYDNNINQNSNVFVYKEIKADNNLIQKNNKLKKIINLIFN